MRGACQRAATWKHRTWRPGPSESGLVCHDASWWTPRRRSHGRETKGRSHESRTPRGHESRCHAAVGCEPMQAPGRYQPAADRQALSHPYHAALCSAKPSASTPCARTDLAGNDNVGVRRDTAIKRRDKHHHGKFILASQPARTGLHALRATQRNSVLCAATLRTMAHTHVYVAFVLVALAVHGGHCLPVELGSPESWTLFWADEFNGNALNTSVWNPKTGTHTNQASSRANATRAALHALLTAASWAGVGVLPAEASVGGRWQSCAEVRADGI